MQAWELTAEERGVIDKEYDRLCVRLRLSHLPLDAYIYDVEAPPDVKTSQGTEVRNEMAGFSERGAIIILPMDDRDALARETTFPPPTLDRHDAEWPLWRIELWHEVIHQLSSQLGVYDHEEPGHRMATGQFWTARGHGDGWLRAIEHAAREFEVAPIQLEELLISQVIKGPISRDEIESLLHEALRLLRESDSDLPADANERSYTHRVAYYLEMLLRGRRYAYSVDCEYNRQGLETKRLDSLVKAYADTSSDELVRDERGRTVFPDVIVHKRGVEGPNILVLEAKRLGASAKELERDRDKLRAYLAEFSYYHAYLILLDAQTDKELERIELYGR